MTSAVQQVDLVRVERGRRDAGTDRIAVEEPLEIRLHGAPFSVTMRTPGSDLELAAGFLFAERVLKCADDLGTIEHCRDPQPVIAPPAGGADPGASRENIVNVTLTGRTREDIDALLAGRRAVLTSSSCGLCGRVTIDSLRTELPAPASGVTVSASLLHTLPDRLREKQGLFDDTGGVHAAGLFGFDGRLEAVAEDVGRHNAVDKVIGRMLMADGLPLAGRVLQVSGRASFEIIQKAALAGVPIVAAVSAPSSLAIDLAREAGLTLIGFVRGGAFNVYTGAERITS